MRRLTLGDYSILALCAAGAVYGCVTIAQDLREDFGGEVYEPQVKCDVSDAYRNGVKCEQVR